MTVNRMVLFLAPILLMILVIIGMAGIEQWLSALGKTEAARLTLGRAGIAIPYIVAAAIGVIVLFASAGSGNIKGAGWGVLAGSSTVLLIAGMRETSRLTALSGLAQTTRSIFSYLDPATTVGAAAVLMAGCFALRIALLGNAAFAAAEPKRIHGRRALHGEADWMSVTEAARLFPDTGGIVIGERYRVDRDSVAAPPGGTRDRLSPASDSV